jgi:hypothetical protein
MRLGIMPGVISCRGFERASRDVTRRRGDSGECGRVSLLKGGFQCLVSLVRMSCGLKTLTRGF